MLFKMGIPHVLLWDSTYNWYGRGVQGIGDIGVVAQYLKNLSQHYKHVVHLGLSAGSYAALLYGQLALTAKDTVIAISPVTGAGDPLKAELPQDMHHRVEQRPGDPPVRDLRLLYLKALGPKTICYVSNGEGTELDLYMANRIECKVEFIPGQSHAGLAKYMTSHGIVQKAILAAAA
jgi:hypothetical protein